MRRRLTLCSHGAARLVGASARSIAAHFRSAGRQCTARRTAFLLLALIALYTLMRSHPADLEPFAPIVVPSLRLPLAPVAPLLAQLSALRAAAPFNASQWESLADPRYRGDCISPSTWGPAPRTLFRNHISFAWCRTVSPWQFPDELLPPTRPPAPRTDLPVELIALSPYPASQRECNPHWLGAARITNQTLYTALLTDMADGTPMTHLIVTAPSAAAKARFRFGGNGPWLPMRVLTSGLIYPHTTFGAALPNAVRRAAVATASHTAVPVVNVTISVNQGPPHAVSACYLPPPREPHYLSICTFFRSDAVRLVEWLEWHLMVGVDHFILYAHAPVDEPQLLLAPYVAAGFVTLVPWPFRPLPHTMGAYHAAQLTSEADCLYRFRSATRYMAVIDTDEYLHPRPPYASVRTIVAELEEQRPGGFGALRVEDFTYQESAEEAEALGRIYGFDRYRDVDRLQIDKYRHRNVKPKTVKVIARTSDVAQWEIHLVRMRPNARATVVWGGAIEILHFRSDRYGRDVKGEFVRDDTVADRFLDRLRTRIANGTSRGVRYYSENLVAIEK